MFLALIVARHRHIVRMGHVLGERHSCPANAGHCHLFGSPKKLHQAALTISEIEKHLNDPVRGKVHILQHTSLTSRSADGAS